jgi:hypothetical protein
MLVLLLFAQSARAATVAWELKQDPSPMGTRFWHAATYDAARHMTVVFGGLKGPTVTGETWGWDGTAWTQLAPENAADPDTPPPRYAATMAYYTKSGGGDGILLFGGFDKNNALLGDTFEFDGATKKWKKLTPATSPSPRYAPALAFHAGLGNVILFGGGDQGATGLAPNDTWGWDGVKWTQLTSGIPPPRAAHAFVYDETRKRLVLFGGFESLLNVRGDTWEFDATGWHERCKPTPCPIPPRFLHAMAYDRQQQRTIMFAGTDSSGQANGDAYAFDGSSWTGISPGGGAGSRSGHVLSFDAARSRMVLFAGRSGVDRADTREALFAGQSCSNAAACGTGFCVDGVCCRDACTGLCKRCDRDNPLFLVQFGAHVKDGVCRPATLGDPDRECGADFGCGGTCGANGKCVYADNEKSCGLCAACNRTTGKCDRIPASGDDVNCPPARCDLASNPCRTFNPQSVNIKRCIAVGKCGWRWEDCSDFQTHDDAACRVFPSPDVPPDQLQDGTCRGGLCLLP